jgi:hypothetical protein
MASAAAVVILKLAQRLREEFEESASRSTKARRSGVSRRRPRLYLPRVDLDLACRRCWGLTYESRSRRNYKDTLHGRVRHFAPG